MYKLNSVFKTLLCLILTLRSTVHTLATLGLQAGSPHEHRCLPENWSRMCPYLCPMGEKESCSSYRQSQSKHLLASHQYELVKNAYSS